MKRFRLLITACFIGLALFSLANTAFAAGTSAGDLINNRATLTYAVGGVNQGSLESSPTGNATLGAGNGTDTTFLVDNRADLSMTGTSSTGVFGTGKSVLFTITNEGNEDQSYRVTWYAETASDDWDMAITGLYLDNGTSPGSWDAGDTLVQLNPVSGTYYAINTDIAPDGTVDILLVGNTPAGVQTNDTAVYTLVAQTLNASTHSIPGGVTTSTAGLDNPAQIDVVLADGASGDTPVNTVAAGTDLDNDGMFLATATFTFTGAGVSIQKTAAVLWDPINGNSNPKAIPGAYVRYTITVSNANGAPSAILQTFSDALQGPDIVIDPNLFTGTDLTPADGPYEAGVTAGKGFRVTHTSARTLTTPLYYTTNADLDGVDHNASVVSANFATLLPDQGVAYDPGELLGNESVTLTFNVIIQ